MIRRIGIVTVGAVILVVAVAATVAAANQQGGRGQTFTVVERATTDVVIDLGDPGDSVGDQLTFGNDLYDPTNTSKVGRDEGNCFRTNPGLAWECTWTAILDGGSLTVQGPFLDSLDDSMLGITGGTGIYWNARGEMRLHARDDLGTEFDFIYSVIR